MNENEKAINTLIKMGVGEIDTNNISDGYHTFGELYEHRIRLYIQICKLLKEHCWFSLKHNDGSSMEGWFVMGLFQEKGKQITYHLPIKFLKEVSEFSQELSKSPEFDGHSSTDVLNRLKNL